MFKSVKSKLLQSLEKDIPILDEVRSDSTLIYDGMCIIQQLPCSLDTFGTISEFVLKRITRNNATEVFFVTDQYFETSIKGGERERRASTGQIRITAKRPDQDAPKQFKKYLSVGTNKTELLEFLLKDWSHHHRNIPSIGSKTIFFTLKDEAYEISVINNEIQCLRVPQLSSNQEEADTKMFLAARHACDRGCNSVTIHTVDSDVAILACYFAPMMTAPLYIKIGTGKNERILNVTLADFGENMSGVLPGLHAFSGCDSTSAFNGIGKSKWLKLVKANELYRDTLCLLGESMVIQQSAWRKYGNPTNDF